MEQKFLTRKEVAELLRIKPVTIAVWESTKKSKFQKIKLHGKILYLKEEVEEYIKSKMTV